MSIINKNIFRTGAAASQSRNPSFKPALDPSAELEQINSALRESEAMFKIVVDSSPLAIYLAEGTDQKANYINPKFTELFGYTIDDIPTADHWFPLAYPDPDYRSRIETEWKRRTAEAFKTGKPVQAMEAVAVCKDGSKKHILWNFISVGRKNISYGQDLTEFKKMEKEKSDFIAIMSHELRNPLAPILAATQLIKKAKKIEKLDFCPIVADALEIIELQSKKLASLLNGFLSVAAQGSQSLGADPTLAPTDQDRRLVTASGQDNSLQAGYAANVIVTEKKPQLVLPEKNVSRRCRRLRIMIIEDNPHIAKLYSRMVELLGHESCFFHNGTEGIGSAAEFMPDLAMVDIGLPDMTGHDVARKLREIEAESGYKTKLIAITGYGQKEDFDRSVDAGFDLHLVKPVELSKLENIISEIAAERLLEKSASSNQDAVR